VKERLKVIFKGPVVFYPLLFAAFPILFLYAYNISEASVSQIWLPMIISVAATLVLWAILSLILRSLAKAAFATTIFLAFFFLYGHFCDGLEYLGLPVAHAYLLPSMLFIWGYCIYFISRTKRDFRVTTRWLNVVAVALIAINLFNIASYQVELARTSVGAPEESPTQTPAASNLTEFDTQPDIYFIILDEYAHPDTMKEWYDYDNSEFFNSLEEKGFFIASKSKTRSPWSPKCLAQILNMEYLTPGKEWDQEKEKYVLTESEDFGSIDRPWSDATFRKLAYSKVADFLKARGYEYIAFGSGSKMLGYMKDVTDQYINYHATATPQWLSELVVLLGQTTMLRPFYYHIIGSEYEGASRRETLYMLEHLKMLPEQEGPKFVFAHFNCPHRPLVFGPNGEHVKAEDHNNWKDKQVYLGQYIFISKQIEELVSVLLEKSEIPPIIILQSDHGVRPHHPDIVVGGDEWHKILNAMYLPFNHYFGADYPLLEDD